MRRAVRSCSRGFLPRRFSSRLRLIELNRVRFRSRLSVARSDQKDALNLFGVDDPGTAGPNRNALRKESINLGFDKPSRYHGLKDVAPTRRSITQLGVPVLRFVEPLDDDVQRQLGHRF
jgi:hypothetical protein